MATHIPDNDVKRLHEKRMDEIQEDLNCRAAQLIETDKEQWAKFGTQDEAINSKVGTGTIWSGVGIIVVVLIAILGVMWSYMSGMQSQLHNLNIKMAVIQADVDFLKTTGSWSSDKRK